MVFLGRSLLAALAETATPPGEESSGGEVAAVILLAVVMLFFVWLVVAAFRKKLSSPKQRLGELTENQEEAAETARLWAEARRKTEADEEEEEPEAEEAGEIVDLQAEMLERARQRHDQKVAVQEQTPTGSAIPAAVAGTPQTKPSELVVQRTLEDGLKKTRDGFVSKLGRLFGKGNLTETEVEELEEIFFTADIGVRTCQKLIDFVQKELTREQRIDSKKLYSALQERVLKMLAVNAPAADPGSQSPFVTLVIGVNGTGKTTTIGKLAMLHNRVGRKVVLAAADTFRAAAGEQLEIWGQRASAHVIRGQDGGDPGSIVFDAITSARSQHADVVIVDTAGRLHTKVNLVEELRKVHRVCGKAMEGAPHEVLLVLDATTGQNAISQAKEFHEALNVTGIVLTKLDGTAKGGVIIGICDTFGIPVRYIGIGEQVEDLRTFDPESFVRALFA